MVGKSIQRCVRRSFALALIFAGNWGIRADSPRPAENASHASGAAIPALELVPTAVRFPNVPLGETYTQTIHLANPGKRPVQIERIVVDAGALEVSGLQLPAVVSAEGSTNFTISYHPRRAGPFSAQVKIVTSGGPQPVMVDIAGSAVDGKTELTSSEAAVHFEDVSVGGRSARQISLANVGNRDLKILSILVAGSDFSVSGEGRFILAPGQTVSLEVSFAPGGTGERRGTLSIFHEDSITPLHVPLSGVGVQASQSAIRLKWEHLSAGPQGYLVYRSSEPGGPYTRISTGAVDASEYADTGLPVGHTYYYVVSALDADNQESEFSEPIVATVPES